MVYGYCRVSSRDQNEDRQLVAMLEAGVDSKNIFIDKQSGKDFNRPMYKKLMRKVKNGDVIYIKSIDRLGRNYKEIIEQWKYITNDKKTDIVVLDMPMLDTRKEPRDLVGTVITDIVLTLLSYVAENERENIRTRQAEGILLAKEKGVRFGRPPIPLPENFHEAYVGWKTKQLTTKEAAALCGMCKTTFYDKAKLYHGIGEDATGFVKILPENDQNQM